LACNCRELLTTAEVENALIRLGAEDIKILKLHQKMDSITDFIIASGNSSRHLNKMASLVVRAVFFSVSVFCP